ncbi:MAG: glycosyltransferase family 4 protein [Pseudomonadota bacterium]
MTTSLLILLCIGICISATVTWLMARVNIADIPEQRSSHAHPTPKCGGIGVLVGLTVTLALFISTDLLVFSPLILILLSTTLGIGVLGLLDDLFTLSFKWRLLVQTTAASFICYYIVPVTYLPIPGLGTLELGWLGWVLSVFWIVGFTNTFNFMDGINGIAAGTALLSGLFLSLFFIHFLNIDFSMVAMALVAGTLGFLPFNFPKAKIFLGDVGSQAMGFLLAVLALRAISESYRISIFTMLLLFLPFCFDSGVTLLRRTLARENVFKAHRTHLYQLLNQLGWSHTQVTILYLALSGISGLTACISLKIPPEHHLYLSASALLFYGAFGYVVLKRARQRKLLA